MQQREGELSSQRGGEKGEHFKAPPAEKGKHPGINC